MRNASTQNRPCRRQRLGGRGGGERRASCLPRVPEVSRQASKRKGRWDRGKGKKETEKRLCVFVHSPYWFINDKPMT